MAPVYRYMYLSINNKSIDYGKNKSYFPESKTYIVVLTQKYCCCFSGVQIFEC